jgi:hypothetical protein
VPGEDPTERRASPVRVLIAGGGVAALEATLALGALAKGWIAITVVASESDFVYRPLAVAEPFRVGEVQGPNRDHDAGRGEPFHPLAKLLSGRAGRPPSLSKFTLPVHDRPSICFERLGA